MALGLPGEQGGTPETRADLAAAGEEKVDGLLRPRFPGQSCPVDDAGWWSPGDYAAWSAPPDGAGPRQGKEGECVRDVFVQGDSGTDKGLETFRTRPRSVRAVSLGRLSTSRGLFAPPEMVVTMPTPQGCWEVSSGAGGQATADRTPERHFELSPRFNYVA